MSVGKICNRSVFIASKGDSVRAAARRMAQNHVGTLVVMDEESHPAGIITDRDVAVRCVAADRNPDQTLVWDVMTAPVHVVRDEMAIEDALSTMASTVTRRLPVVDDEGTLIGILSLDDVLELLIEEAETIGRLLRHYTPHLQPE